MANNYYYALPEEEGGTPKDDHPFFGQDGEIENSGRNRRIVSSWWGLKKEWRETTWLSDFEEPQSSYPFPND
ncbi:MAG: hypothetical protein J2P37_00300 [Ktedonobacteraceae bacterium]|nr:hypothetical protein [Ktedonobacteraceae bacterium]